MNTTRTLQLREQIRQWKSGMNAANIFSREQALRSTPAERLVSHQRFLEGHACYGIALENPADREHRIPYHELQERLIARLAKRNSGG